MVWQGGWASPESLFPPRPEGALGWGCGRLTPHHSSELGSESSGCRPGTCPLRSLAPVKPGRVPSPLDAVDGAPALGWPFGGQVTPCFRKVCSAWRAPGPALASTSASCIGAPGSQCVQCSLRGLLPGRRLAGLTAKGIVGSCSGSGSKDTYGAGPLNLGDICSPGPWAAKLGWLLAPCLQTFLSLGSLPSGCTCLLGSGSGRGDCLPPCKVWLQVGRSLWPRGVDLAPPVEQPSPLSWASRFPGTWTLLRGAVELLSTGNYFRSSSASLESRLLGPRARCGVEAPSRARSTLGL